MVLIRNVKELEDRAAYRTICLPNSMGKIEHPIKIMKKVEDNRFYQIF